jgi:hypothetical protein
VAARDEAEHNRQGAGRASGVACEALLGGGLTRKRQIAFSNRIVDHFVERR